MSSLNRRPHVLNREKSMAIPRDFIFFDTETTQYVTPDGDIEQVFKLGWCVYWGREYGRHKERIEWVYFDNVLTFWEFVFSKSLPKQKLWIIARNIVFDFTVCKGWEYLKREGYKLKFFHNNGVCCIVKVHKGNRSIVFLDSMNWFPESLEKTGERIGIPKMKIDFATCTLEELIEYCHNDVRIEFENIRIFIRFLQGNHISRLCYTRASTAMAAYLLRHYHTPIYIHNNAEAIKLERDSYKGGRCECFYIGELNGGFYYILDVNSLYPYVMANRAYPVKYKSMVHNVSVSRLTDYVKSYAVVSRVQVNTQEPVYAIKRDRTIFPIGIYDTVLTTPEISYAIEHGHIKKVYDVVVYEQANIFSSYVKTMYTLRQDFKSAGVGSYEQLCKYLMNSLYGKFGQKAENWERIGDAPDEPDREELLFTQNPHRVYRIRYLLGQVFQLKGYGESYNSFPAIAAHVTAYGRMYLWYLMNIAGKGNYYYCDTDSLIVNDTGLENLYMYLDDNELGKLKLEQTLKHITIWGLKDYKTDTKTAIKGIRKTAVYLGDNTFSQEQWPSFKGTLKSSDANKYVVHKTTKHLTREYTKGNVTDCGNVTPFVFS